MARKSGTYTTVEKFLLDVQRESRILGHAALVRSWDIAISVSVHMDNLPKRIETAYKYAATLPEAEERYFKKSLRRLYRGWQLANRAVAGGPAHGVKDRHGHRDAAGLRAAALEMYSGAGEAYSLMHHIQYPGWGGGRGYLATRHEFKRSLRHRRKQVSRNLSAWPAQADRRKARRNSRGRYTRG